MHAHCFHRDGLAGIRVSRGAMRFGFRAVATREGQADPRTSAGLK
jgi:hypothetical protein